MWRTYRLLHVFLITDADTVAGVRRLSVPSVRDVYVCMRVCQHFKTDITKLGRGDST